VCGVANSHRVEICCIGSRGIAKEFVSVSQVIFTPIVVFIEKIGPHPTSRVLPDLSLFNITLTPTLKSEIIAAQKNDEGMGHIRRKMQESDPKVACFCEAAKGTLWLNDRLVVPKRESLKKKILDEAHTSRYSIHLGITLTPRVTLFLLPYKLNPASSAMVNQVVEVRNQNSKSGVRI
jgi:hypothetical protein